MSNVIPQRELGKSGVKVGCIGLGCMNMSSVHFGQTGTDPNIPRDPWFDVMKKAIEMGCNLFNTGEIYGDNEAVLNEFFTKNPELREKVFISVKAGMKSMVPTGDPEYIKDNIEFNLKQLGVKKIDLYQMARVDTKIPIEITIKAIAEKVKEGKVGYIGLSECDADTIRRAHKVHPITCVEIEYSMWVTDPEELGTLKTCEELGIAVIAYSPLGKGIFTGALKSVDDAKHQAAISPRFAAENWEKNMKLITALENIAKRLNVAPAQLAIAWTLHQSPNVIPIPGTTKVDRLVQNLGAANIQLSKEDLESIRSAMKENDVVGDRYNAHVSAMNHGKTPSLDQYQGNKQ